MKKRLAVKVCGMKYASNTKELESLPIDIFGFVFYPPSPRFAGETGREERAELAATPKTKAGVFVNASLPDILNYAASFGLSIIQLHGEESPLLGESLKREGFLIIKSFHVGPDFDFTKTLPWQQVADYFLFDTKTDLPGGSGQKFNWTVLSGYQGHVPFFLSGGISKDDAESILTFHHPALYGVDVNSGFEERPGWKNRDMLKEFLREICS